MNRQQKPKSSAKSEQEYNSQFTTRQFHENDYVAPICARVITTEECDLLRTAYAKSYKVPEKLINIKFENLPPDDPLHKDYLEFCIYILGDYETETKGNNFTIDTTKRRKVFSILAIIPENLKAIVAAQQRTHITSITSGSPLHTIHIGELPKAVAPKNRRLQLK